MKIGIAVFAYNRADHLIQTLNGLKCNEEVKKIYIFQDGLKKEEHKIGWLKSRGVIQDIDWCKTVTFFSTENKGLSRSIREGISRVLQENDAIIVLEDDCVPTCNFVKFMTQCLEKYKDNSRVYSVNGYSRPININKDYADVYFMPKFYSWGWGTWKDRWDQYVIDNGIWDRIKSDVYSSLYVAVWGGNSTERFFYDRLAEKNDSWAVYWSLKIFEARGVCITPYDSFIQNIGFDGSGVHCKKTEEFRAVLEDGKKTKYMLPDHVALSNEVSKEMVALYGGYTGINNDQTKTNILIYGLGNFFYENEKYVNDNFYIKAFIDLNKDGYYAGKEIVKPKDIWHYEYRVILIMLRDICECYKIKKMLALEYKIPYEKVKIGTKMIQK